MKKIKISYLNHVAPLIFILFHFWGCGGLIESISPGGTSRQVIDLKLTPVYPVNGGSWNDYIEKDGTDFFDANDIACAGDGGECLHAGILRKAEFYSTYLNGCSSEFVIEDSLGAFNWTCRYSNNYFTLYLTGFKEGKGLSDIITEDDWKENQIVFKNKNGAILAKSTLGKWWSNPVELAPQESSVQTLSDEGKIYTVSSDQDTHGYNINADKISFVVLGNFELKNVSSTNNCALSTGEVDAADSVCILSAGSQKYLWVEGRFNSNGTAHRSTLLAGLQYSRLNNIKVRTSSIDGIYMRGIISGDNFENNLITNVSAFNNTNYGIYLEEGQKNIFRNIVASNNGGNGVEIRNSSYNIFTKIISHHNTGNGVRFHTTISPGLKAIRNTVLNITAAFNSESGFYIHDLRDANNHPSYDDYNTVVNVVSYNNGIYGLHFNSSDFNMFSQVASIDNNTRDLYFIGSGSFRNAFQDNALFGGSGWRCEISSGHTNEIGNNCLLIDTSSSGFPQPEDAGKLPVTVAIMEANSLSNGFVGKISDYENYFDSLNSSDTGDGTAPFNDISDWFNFENILRSWGRGGTDRGRCLSGDTCHIWDWMLAAGSIILNTTYDGEEKNENFTEVEQCPAAVHGNYSISDMQAPYCLYRNNCGTNHIFLVNAFEIIGDGVGNDNGLCESGEACIYSPNFGAYQGHGSLKASCKFVNGTGILGVSNVTMYAYSENGN